MRPGFSNYLYTKEYFCIYLTSSMYLLQRGISTRQRLFCKACAERLLQIKALSLFFLLAEFLRILKQSAGRDKNNCFPFTDNAGIWQRVTNGCVLAGQGLYSPLHPHRKTQSSTTDQGAVTAVSTAYHPHSTAWAPRHGVLLDPVHNLPLTAPKSSSIVMHWLLQHSVPPFMEEELHLSVFQDVCLTS